MDGRTHARRGPRRCRACRAHHKERRRGKEFRIGTETKLCAALPDGGGRGRGKEAGKTPRRRKRRVAIERRGCRAPCRLARAHGGQADQVHRVPVVGAEDLFVFYDNNLGNRGPITLPAPRARAGRPDRPDTGTAGGAYFDMHRCYVPWGGGGVLVRCATVCGRLVNSTVIRVRGRSRQQRKQFSFVWFYDIHLTFLAGTLARTVFSRSGDKY